MNEEKDILFFIKSQMARGNRVDVSISGDGKTHFNTISNVTYVKVGTEEYGRIIETIKAIEKEKEIQKREEEEEFAKYVEEVTHLVESNNNKGSRIQGTINKVGSQPPRRNIKSNRYPSPNNNMKRLNRRDKKSVKGKPKTKKMSKFKLGGISVLLASGILIGYNLAQIRDYKEEAYEETLYEVKEKLAESFGVSAEEISIKDNSTFLSSNCYLTNYLVKVNGKEYEYTVYDEAGTKTVKTDTIVNDDVKEAISTVGKAQNGNVLQAVKAKNFAKKIKSGEVNLNIPTNRSNTIYGEENER